MAPVKTAAAPDRPAKRRKVRSAKGGDSEDSLRGRALKTQRKQQEQKHGETLSIRGRRQATQNGSTQPADDLEAEKEDDRAPEEGGRESTDSPPAQLAGAVQPQLSRSQTYDESEQRSHSESRSGSRAQSQSHSQSPPPRTSGSRSAYQSLSQSPSRSRSRHLSQSPSPSSSPSPSPSRSRPQSESESGSESEARSRRRRRRRGSWSSTSPQPHYRRVFSMRGHDGPVSQVRISPDGRWIASASADATARIWDAATGAHITTLVGHLAGLSCLAWSPDSNTLATGSDDKSIRLWDRVTAEPAHSLVHGSGGEPGAGLEELNSTSLPYHSNNSNSNSNRNNANSNNNNNNNSSSSSKASTTAARVRASQYARSSRLDGTASGGARGTRLPLLGHHNYVYCLAFSPKGNILASGSYDEAVFLWDVRAGRLMRSLPAHSDPVSGIDFCCDGTLVVSCSTDGLIRIWDTGTGQCLRTLLLLNEDNPAVTNVCFSPNGRYVLAFNLDSCIRLWDYVAQPSIVKKTYQGHLNKAFSIGGCFGVLEEGGGRSGSGSPNGQEETQKRRRQRLRPFVAAASEDGDVVLWDVGTKAVVQRLRRAHKGGVCFWVDVCGATMVSCGQDGWINVYRHKEKAEEPEEEGRANEEANRAEEAAENGEDRR